MSDEDDEDDERSKRMSSGDGRWRRSEEETMVGGKGEGHVSASPLLVTRVAFSGHVQADGLSKPYLILVLKKKMQKENKQTYLSVN